MSRAKADAIHTSDEETEVEDDDNRTVATAKSGKTAGEKKEGEPQAEELLKTKRPRYNKPFTEDLLMGVTGLPRIYNEFPLACNKHPLTRGSEAAFLKRLITLYKEWAFQLHPGVSFEDVVMKCETLGSKGRVRGYMQQMRENERDRYIDEVLMPLMRARDEEDAEKLKSISKPKKSRKHKSHHPRESDPDQDDIPTQAESSAIKQNDEESMDVEDDVHTQKQTQSKATRDPFDDDDEEWEFPSDPPKKDAVDADPNLLPVSQDDDDNKESSATEYALSNEGREKEKDQEEETGAFRTRDIEEKDFSTALDDDELFDEPTQEQ